MKLVLSGIVKNESKIIERCLDNCKSVVDAIALTDTGSNDRTPEIIEEWGKRNNVPVHVTRSKWVNFSVSRTEALRNSEKAFPSAEYLLLIDADMVLENHGFNKDDLTADAYNVEQYNPSIRYDNTRVVKVSMNWYYEGVTHEYITCSTEHKKEDLRTLRILDIGDGGSKSDKFTRDIKLLLDGLHDKKTAPHLKVRYTFYLAQSYYDTQQYSKALRYYRQRIEMGGYEMEVWFSMYKSGLCLKELDRWEEAHQELLKAYSYKPHRCEPLVEILDYYTFKKPNYPMCDLYIHRLYKMASMPNEDGLFNMSHYKDYYIYFLISIVAYYCKEKQLGLDASDKVLKSSAPEHYKKTVESNITHYSKIID